MSGHGDRDRDPAGRPRSARPRDLTGRPLARGAPGVPRIPDDLRLPPDATLARAQQLIDSGEFFAAHEVLEAAWKDAPPPERGLWRALAQLAVGLTHAQRGNHVGAAALLLRAAAGLRDCDGDLHGVEAAALATVADTLAESATQGRLADVVAARVRLAR